MTVGDVLNELGVPFLQAGESHHVSSDWFGTCCPWCGKQEHLGIPPSANAASCWTCGSHNLAKTLATLSTYPLDKVRKLLMQVNGFKEGQNEYRRERHRHSHYLVVPPYLDPPNALRRVHQDYLRSRDLHPYEVCKRWGVRSIGPIGDLKWRLYIPIHHRGDVVSWTTRSINPDSDQRYWSASADQETFPHKNLLYGEDFARNAIIVVEGPFDAWRIGPGAVATFGTKVSMAQINRIARHPVRVICFDNTPEATAAAGELAAKLEILPGTTLVAQLETGKDAGDADRAEIDELRKRFLQEYGYS